MPSLHRCLLLQFTGILFPFIFLFLIFIYLWNVVFFLWLCPGYVSLLQLGEEGVCLAIDYSSLSRKASSGTRGKNLEAGPEAETPEQCCLLTCSPWLTQFAF